jgi:hypothetical protein
LLSAVPVAVPHCIGVRIGSGRVADSEVYEFVVVKKKGDLKITYIISFQHHHHVSATKLWDFFACNSFVGFEGFFFFSNF